MYLKRFMLNDISQSEKDNHMWNLMNLCEESNEQNKLTIKIRDSLLDTDNRLTAVRGEGG